MKYIIVTGGAGFIGTNLISKLVKLSSYKIISYDNYSTGLIKNHIIHKNVKYVRGDTIDFDKTFKSIKKKIKVIFHFAEFSRISQSFENINDCLKTNITGSFNVINFCLKNKIKIIYSATSASLGNNGLDKNLSPYAFSKSTNMNLIMNLNEWFGLKYEIIYFYNVYGPFQITNNHMAAVVGIFEDCYKKNKSLPVVKPGSQTRKFTHVDDTIDTCIYAWKKNRNRHYSISFKHSISVKNLAKLFSKKYKMIPQRKGERFKSSEVKEVRGRKIYNLYGKISIKDYINKLKK